MPTTWRATGPTRPGTGSRSATPWAIRTTTNWNLGRPLEQLSAVITVSGSSTETIGTDPRFGERTINDLQADAVRTNFWHLAVPLATGSNDLVAVIGDLAGNVGQATNSIEVTIVTNASYGYDDAGNVTNIEL